MADTPTSVQRSEEEWRAILSPEQFRILRQKGTEMRGTGEYDKFFEEGIYNCGGCGTPLYKSTTKFNSGCGWPAFFEGLPGAITRSPDPDGRRTEIICMACGGHLGHVFKGEGYKTPTDERHCVNSVSIKFVPAGSSAQQKRLRKITSQMMEMQTRYEECKIELSKFKYVTFHNCEEYFDLHNYVPELEARL